MREREEHRERVKWSKNDRESEMAKGRDDRRRYKRLSNFVSERVSVCLEVERGKLKMCAIVQL